MTQYVVIILVLILLFYIMSKSEYLEKHKTTAYLIHEATSDQCFECRAIRNYFHNALGNQYELDLHSYHTQHDYAKIQALASKYNFQPSNTPILLVVHDNGTHEVFNGYASVHQAITMLRYHPYLERKLNL
jgi:hypothetical protein